MIIDIHTHTGTFPHGDPDYDYLGETMSQFNQALTEDSVSHCIIAASSHALLKDTKRGNDITFMDAETDSRLYGCLYFNPLNSHDSIDSIAKHYTNPKFVGFKTRPMYHGLLLNKDSYKPLISASVTLHKPVLVHCSSLVDAYAIAEVAKTTSEFLVMIHACMEDYAKACELVAKYPNVVVEPVTSKVYPNKIRNIINIIGHERVLFGSDYGLLSRARVLKTYEDANLSDVEQNVIFRDNAKRVFNLK